MTAHPLSLLAEGAVYKSTGDYLVACDAFQGAYPTLFDLLALGKWEGKARETGNLMIFVSSGRATVRVMDPDSCQVCFFTESTISDALEGLERALVEGRADWREDRRKRNRPGVDRARK